MSTSRPRKLPRAGDVLAGRFRILGPLGRGGEGSVFRVEDQRTGELRALKVFATETDTVPREVELLVGLRHPHVATLHDFHTSPVPFITMDLVEGADLTASAGALAPSAFRHVAGRCLETLAFLHGRGLLHRDLKPANVRLTPDGEPVLLDLGLAAFTWESRPPAGTRSWVAPEVLAGAQQSEGSDLFALGKTLDACASNATRRAYGAWIERLVAPRPGARFASARDALAHLSVDEAPLVLAGPRLVGRDDELDRAATWLVALKSGRPHPSLVILDGVPGSGRRRLATAVKHRAQMLGLATTEVRPPTDRAPTSPLRSSDPSRADLRASQTRAALLDADAVRDRLESAPGLVFADGSLSFDRDVVRCLLAAASDDAPVTVVLTKSPHGSELDDLLRVAQRPETLRLEPLSAASCRILLSDALALPEAASGLAAPARAIAKAVGAQPGPFLTAVRSLVADGSLAIVNDRPVLTAAQDLIAQATADVTPLLTGLSPNARHAAQSLLAFGAPLCPAARRALDITPETAAALVRRGLAQRSFHDGQDVLTPAIPGEIPPLEDDARRALHTALAKAAANATFADPTLEAWHLLHAGAWERGAPAALEAAQDRLAAGDIADARRLLEAIVTHRGQGGGRLALDAALLLARLAAALGEAPAARDALAFAMDRTRSGRPRARVHLAHGSVSRTLGELPDAVVSLDRALGTGDLSAAERTEALRLRGICRLQLGELESALSDTEEAVATAPTKGQERAVALANRAQVLHRTGRGSDALADLTAAVDALRRSAVPDPILEASLVAQRGMVRRARGDTSGAREDLLESCHGFRTGGHQINLAVVLNNLGVLYEVTGEPLAALEAHEEALAIRRRTGDAVGIATSTLNLGEQRFALGRLSEARRDFEYAERDFSALDHPRGLLRARIGQARVATVLGRCEPARRMAQSALEDASARELTEEADLARLAQGEVALGTGDAPGIRDAVTEVGEPALAARRDVLLAEAALLAGQAAEARELGERARTGAIESKEPETTLRARLFMARSEPDAATDWDSLVSAVNTTPFRLLRIEGLRLLVARTGNAAVRARLANATEELFEGLDDEDGSALFTDVWKGRLHAQLGELTVPANPSPSGLDTVLRISRLLASEIPSSRLLEEILDGAIEISGAQHGFIVLRTSEGFGCVTARRTGRTSIRVPDDLVSSTVIQDVLSSGSAVSSENAQDDPRFGGLSSVNRLELTSVACLPFTAQGEVRGAIYLDHREREGLFAADQLRLLSTFADHAAIAYLRSQREERIRHLNSELKSLLEKEVRHSKEVSAQLREARRSERGRVVAESESFQEVLRTARRVARTDIPVLLCGETGVGKDVLAQQIHFDSSRSQGPFLSENCTAIPEGLVEAELFGSVRGAFTGAIEDRPGLLVLANGGTLFLDEVGDLELEVQAKLLRALEEGAVRPVGGAQKVATSFRLVTATNRPVDELRSGVRFRTDLFFRISGAVVSIPPLRERKEDIAAFIDQRLESGGRSDLRLEPSARRKLLDYEWPGNFRELANELARAIALADGPVISESGLSERIRRHEPADEEIPFDLEALRRWAFQRALRTCEGDKADAARLLGISRSTLYHELKKHGLQEFLRSYTRRTSPDGARRGAV